MRWHAFEQLPLVFSRFTTLSTATKTVKTISLICFSALLAGCVIAADYNHFEPASYSEKTYQKFSITWCSEFSDVSNLEVCSPAYRRKSKSIGLLIPFIPQLNRNSRFAYDIKRERHVLLKSTEGVAHYKISDLNTIQVCADQTTSHCAYKNSLMLRPGEQMWLKLSAGARHTFTIHVDGKTFPVELLETTTSKWHMVTV